LAFRCKIEASIAGKEYATVLDKMKNQVTMYTEFDEIPAHPLPFRSFDYDGVAAPRNDAARGHGIHGFWQGRAGPDALVR